MFIRKLITFAIPILAALSLSLFFASLGDFIHLFENQGGEWHSILSSQFINNIPLSLLSGFLVVAAVWLISANALSHTSGRTLAECLELDALTYVPFIFGLLIPLRYIEGMTHVSSFLYLVVSTLMGPLFLVSLLISIYLKYKLFRPEQNDLIDKNSLFSGISDKSVGWIIFVAVTLFFVVCTPFISARMPFGGDQPHYLIVTHSLVEDGDIYIQDDHDAGAEKTFTELRIEPQFFVRTTEGKVIPFHRIGMPILAMLPYALGGKFGALLLIGLLSALSAANLYWLIMKLVPNRPAAIIATVWATFTVPVLPLSFMFFSEIPALLITLICLNLLIRSTRDELPRFPWILPALIWTLPWMHARDMITAIALSLFLIVRMRRKPLMAAGLLILCIVFSFGIPLYNLYFYGTLSPVAEMGNDQNRAFGFMNVVNGLGGLLFDQEYGLILYNPALILALVGLIVLVRKKPAETFWLVLVAGFSIGPNILYRMWWGGGSPPGRYYVAIFHLAAIPLAAFLAQKEWKRWRPVFVLLLVCGIALAATLMINDFLLFNDRDGSARFLSAISSDSIDAVEWWPSWFGDIDRSWLLTAVLTAWSVASVGILFSVRSLFAKRKWFAGFKPAFRITTAMLYFLAMACIYSTVAELITPEEPNGHQPYTHKSDTLFQERYRNGDSMFIGLLGRYDIDQLPGRRFSSELIFSVEQLLVDEKASRNRSRRIGAKGELFNLVSASPVWAGDYVLKLSLRSEAETGSVKIEVNNHSSLRKLLNDPGRRHSLSDDFIEISVPFSLTENSRGLQVRLTPDSDIRFQYALVQTTSLIKKDRWKHPPALFESLVWQFGHYMIFTGKEALYPSKTENFWTVGDSGAHWTICSENKFSSLEFIVRGRPGITVVIEAAGKSHKFEFKDSSRVKTLTIPVTAYQSKSNEDFWYSDLKVITSGSFIPAESISKSEDKRTLGAQFKLELK